jgi:hypothetical protein
VAPGSRPSLRVALRIWLLGALLIASASCAGDLVIRAPEQDFRPIPGPLARLAPLEVEMPPAAGADATRKVVGERAAGLGLPGGPIALTEDPGHLIRRIVAGELRAAGHQVVDDGSQVALAVLVEEFRVDAPRHGSGWDVVARVRVLLRIARTPDDPDHTELVYTAERRALTYLRPSLATTERVLGECLDDLAQLVSERASLAQALEAHARRGSAQGPPRVEIAS